MTTKQPRWLPIDHIRHGVASKLAAFTPTGASRIADVQAAVVAVARARRARPGVLRRLLFSQNFVWHEVCWPDLPFASREPESTGRTPPGFPRGPERTE
jgi:hypothetical protein